MNKRRIAALSLMVGIVLTTFIHADQDEAVESLPYHKEILDIIDPLIYSGFQALLRPEVSLVIDFNKRSWKLLNVHRYNDQGQILLEKGRYGLCAELSTYVYEQLKPLLGDQYDLKFTMAIEKGFFPTYESNHIVLLMQDRTSQNVYLIDPSFHKYGTLKEERNYKVLGTKSTLSFYQDKTLDVSFLVDQATPLFIKDDLLLSLAITSVDGKFDKDNFFISVAANQKNKISGMNVVLVGKYNGQLESFEDKAFLEHLLSPEDIEGLQKKIELWVLQNQMDK